jgi:hypothetical protein
MLLLQKASDFLKLRPYWFLRISKAGSAATKGFLKSSKSYTGQVCSTNCLTRLRWAVGGTDE